MRERHTRAIGGAGVRVLLGLLLVGSSLAPLQAEIIPAERRITWSGNVGVPGGIPNRTKIFATIDADKYGTGSTDASSVINAALAECPADQVVYLPQGTYRLDSAINFGHKEHVTLRGAGMGKTVLKPADGSGTAITTGQAGVSSERKILGGSTKGSTSITVEDASGIEPGLILDILQDDDPDFFWARGSLVNHTGQFVMVTAVDGATIRFEDPLVWDFTLNPRCRPSRRRGMRWCGIEDLTISAGSSYGGGMIKFWHVYASWIKNVETAWGKGNDHIWLCGSLRCEIRECHIHDTYSTTDGYGIVTQSGYGGPRGGCTGTLIENNIFSGLRRAIVLQTEVGSVVGYNFSRNIRFTGWPNYMICDFNGNHGPHGMMCLFEGNLNGGGIQQDGYHGSVSHTTYFRNHLSGKHVEPHRTGNITLIDLCRFSYYQNVVGNVLGFDGWPANGVYEMSGKPSYTSQPCIYRLGYPNMGNNAYSDTNPPSNGRSGGLDPKVKATLLRHGNYDYQNRSVVWDPAIADRDLPASLYLTGKPGWWGDLPWPPVGPDVPGLTNSIPAQVRFEEMDSGEGVNAP